MMQQKIKDDMKAAMVAKDSIRLSVIRGLMSSFTNELVAKGRKPDGELTDEEVLTLIKRAVKQRKDSISQFNEGGRADLAKKEEEELQFLTPYLPAELSVEEIKKVAEAKKAELGVTDKTKAGMLMSSVMKELKGRADGNAVKAVVDELLG